MRERKKKVFLGLSGGVDSAVAGALLLERGYDVTPVFLKCWEDSRFPGRGESQISDSYAMCPWKEDQEAALAAAKHLGIFEKFQSWNFTKEFSENVVQYLVDEATRGRTGNPDVVCNRTVKFGAFLERALAEGADFVATGHYARISLVSAASDPGRTPGQQSFQLLRPQCEAKNDQTYFLWQLTQKQLKHVLFPIGDFSSKEAVREEARKRGIPSADRRSTRGICFVGKDVGYAGFLEQFINTKLGQVVTTSGRVVGQHRGAAFATLGQRQGIGVSDAHGPYYVVKKDLAHNRLVVAAPAEAQQLYRYDITVEHMHWISGIVPIFPFSCTAFIRHPQHHPVACRIIDAGKGTLAVTFTEAQYAPAPGQSVVFYDGDTVLGGGNIAL